MDMARALWVEKSLFLLPSSQGPDQDSALSFVVQQAKTSQAALSAARSTAAMDWGWGDSTDTLLLYEWGFEAAMDQYFIAAQQVAKSPIEVQSLQEKESQWRQLQVMWNAERSQVAALAEKFNKMLVFPVHPLLVRVFPKATLWMSKKQYEGFKQTSRNLP